MMDTHSLRESLKHTFLSTYQGRLVAACYAVMFACIFIALLMVRSPLLIITIFLPAALVAMLTVYRINCLERGQCIIYSWVEAVVHMVQALFIAAVVLTVPASVMSLAKRRL